MPSMYLRQRSATVVIDLDMVNEADTLPAEVGAVGADWVSACSVASGFAAGAAGTGMGAEGDATRGGLARSLGV